MQREEANIAREFPLHYLVWTKNIVALRTSLQPDNVNFQHLEQLDPRGRTPLMLAVTLENLDCAILLLENGANVNVENKEGWTGSQPVRIIHDCGLVLTRTPLFFNLVVQEAVSTGNHQIISAVLQKRDLQRHTTRMLGVPALLQKLKEVTFPL